MILIADSGSTRTDWVIIDNDFQLKRYETIGFNPYYSPAGEISNTLEKELVPFIDNNSVNKVFYYGAGCSTRNKCFIVEEALEKVFPNARLEVNHDLLGASRGLFMDNEGIACILGTGSSSCKYDGEKIVENIPSLGYLFGDEGSGAHIGKQFIIDYLRGKLPNTIKEGFEKKFNFSLENILDSVYNQPRPSRFLGSFMEFVGEYKSDKYVKTLVKSSFKKFFGEQVTKYSGYDKIPVSIVGSVGYYFKDILKEVAKTYHVSIREIQENPMEGLIKFHCPLEDQT